MPAIEDVTNLSEEDLKTIAMGNNVFIDNAAEDEANQYANNGEVSGGK